MAGWDFLNMYDTDRIYKEEGSALNDNRSKIDYDIGDNFRWLGAALLGRGDEFTREGLRKGAAENLETRINKAASPDIGQIQQSLAGSQIDLTDLNIRPNETKLEYDNRIASLKNTGLAALQAVASTPNFDMSKIGPGATVGTVTAQQAAQRDENTETAEQKAEQKLADERTYQTALTTAQHAHTAGENARLYAHQASEANRLNAWKTEQENLRLAHTAEQNNLTRQHQTDVAKYDAETKIKLGMMESADRRADRRAQREDRLAAQRQASIMQLIKGLTQLGAGMAI